MVSNVKRKSKRKSKRKKIPDKWEQKKKKNQKDTYQKQKWEKNEKNKTEPNQIRTSLGTSTLLFENKCMRFIYTLKDTPCSNKNRSGPVHMYGYPRYRVPHTVRTKVSLAVTIDNMNTCVARKDSWELNQCELHTYSVYRSTEPYMCTYVESILVQL